MTTRLYLTKERKDGRKRIDVKVHPGYGMDSFRVQTKHYIDPSTWNQTVQSSSDPVFNSIIQNMQLIFTEIERELIIKKIPPTKDYVTGSFRYSQGYRTKQETVSNPTSFFDYFDRYQLKWRNKKSQEYLRKFISAKKNLMAFNPALKFSDITEEFFDDYTDWCIGTYRRSYGDEVGLSNNTIEKYVTCLRLVCDLACREGEEIESDYENFKYKGNKVRPIWLTLDEAHDLLNVKLENEMEEKILDEAALRYYTGLRSSDANQIGPHHLVISEGQEYLNLRLIKTGSLISLPLHQKAIELLEKYKYEMPKIAMQQKNSVIKILAKRAGINLPVEFVRESGSNKAISVSPKYELITTHTMRKSFGRRFMECVGDINQLCLIYGHSEPKTSMDYIDWQPKELAESINQIKF